MTDRSIHQTLSSNPRLGLTRWQKKVLSYTNGFLLLFVLQAVLALLINQIDGLSTFHAYATLLVGLFFLIIDKTPDRLMYWMGYVAGAELLWRGTGASVFWETGKFAIIGFSLLGSLKSYGKHHANFNMVPYFLLLIPAIFLMPSFNRETITYALAGPLALMSASIFFSRIEIKTEQLKRLLLSIIASVITFSVLALVGLINAETIEFSQASNFITSANTGPNQVSSVLALGAFVAFIYVFIEKEHKYFRFLVILLGIGLLAQVTLTFSRGGLWTLIGGIAAGGLFFMRDKKARRSYFVILFAVILFFNFLLLPMLDQWTSGSLGARIRDTEPTGRLEIIRSDLEVFQENPLFGIGLGQSDREHARYFRVSNSHTEYSRMLAEHGVFGLISLIILLIVLGQKILKKGEPVNKAIIVAFLTWGLLFMAHSATRLAAPSFLIGLAFAHFDLSIPIEVSKEERFTRFGRMHIQHRD